jgi:hypothetical protein
MIKKLELQNSTCPYILQQNINPLHFQRAYFVHFETNLNDFCNFGCNSGGLQNLFKLEKQLNKFQIFMSFYPPIYHKGCQNQCDAAILRGVYQDKCKKNS